MTDDAVAGPAERYATILTGAALAFAGLRRGDWVGTAVATAGGGLFLAGAAGVPVLERVGAGRIAASLATDAAGLLPVPDEPVKVQANVTILAPAQKLFRFWRNFGNHPKLFPHLERVDVEDATHSTWIARGPGGTTVRWRSEVDGEREDELISWHTLEGAELPHRGSVMFLPAPGERGTQVRFTMSYHPPGGAGGRAVARLFGAAPERQAREALRRLKRLMETGSVPTIEGQPHGNRGRREMVG